MFRKWLGESRSNKTGLPPKACWFLALHAQNAGYRMPFRDDEEPFDELNSTHSVSPGTATILWRKP
ncbi:hypothetical protein C7460_106118 [Marinoscillum furvescens DSM 4134]|uniref:Uncharacterized protein n=1 Tax=Marinoscillum furvescens DSM 4134 TaxID=1122208 RepID=A0A3D9L3Z7_MARFU|nr:hypothetical protein C7460_106118 [Marinoscillum furvescens DSM 4134]